MPNDYESFPFEVFLAEQLKNHGITLKKLSDVTGIAPVHLENLVHGNYDEMPSAPYFHGYLSEIGRVLGFDAEEWWVKLKKEGLVKNSGPQDELPRNRFVRQSAPKLLWGLAAAAGLLAIYFAFAFPRIFGTPSLTVVYPVENPSVATTTTVTIQGTVRNADAVYLSNGSTSSSDEIMIAPDGSWQKTVLLQNGLNTFEISAKKFLGGETSITEQILYQAPGGTPGASSSTSSSSPGSGGGAGAGSISVPPGNASGL